MCDKANENVCAECDEELNTENEAMQDGICKDCADKEDET